MVRNLAVFDFDKTVVDDDSDATIIRRLREREPAPEWNNKDWTPYMSNVFEHAFTAGLQQEEILDSIASMTPNKGIIELFNALSAANWDILILSDANTVFVEHWIKSHNLQNTITAIITNRAFWQHGRLYIEPCMPQNTCSRCPTNLCKSLALRQWRAGREYERVAYTGDGRNDYCPSTSLSAKDCVFPRKDFPLWQLINKDMATPTPEVVAKVVPWESGNTILNELLKSSLVETVENKNGLVESCSSDLIKVK